MKEALYYKEGKNVQCVLCPRNCVISEDSLGFCRVRKNIKGKLYSLVYGKVSSAVIDPIEKKPLFHFLPDSSVFSVGTVGCNLRCLHCQNWEISQVDEKCGKLFDMSPEEIVNEAKRNNCAGIAYTYNDPIIFYEFALDTAKLAKKKDLKNILVTNGFINKEPMKEWLNVMDAANIDLKGFTSKFYKEITTAWLDPVLDTLKLVNGKLWLEITNLIIPGKNDKLSDIRKMCKWIKDNLGENVPLHFSRFYSQYKLEADTTPEKTLEKARDIAIKEGLKYIYIGNTSLEENTYCPKCNEVVIERQRFSVIRNNLVKGKCGCGEKIDGVW